MSPKYNQNNGPNRHMKERERESENWPIMCSYDNTIL